MFFRNWINILFLLAATYGSWQVMTGRFMSYGWQYYFYLLAPWILLYGSIRSWHRCFTWRRMIEDKNIAPDLSRGQHTPSKRKQRISILERVSIALFLISIAAILQQLGIANAALYIALAIGSYAALSVIIRMVR